LVREILKAFVLDGLVLEEAAKIVSENQLDGLQVLFADIAKGLASRNQHAQEMCESFNKFAPAFDVEPITASELEKAIRTEAPKLSESFVSLGHAGTAIRIGNQMRADRYLAPLLRPAD